MREQGRICGNDHNDRAALGFIERRAGVSRTFGNFHSHPHTGNTQIGAAAIIALNEYTDGVAALLLIEYA